MKSVITVLTDTDTEPTIMAELILLQRQGVPLEVTIQRGEVQAAGRARGPRQSLPKPQRQVAPAAVPVAQPVPQRQPVPVASAPPQVTPRPVSRVGDAAARGRAAREAAAIAAINAAAPRRQVAYQAAQPVDGNGGGRRRRTQAVVVPAHAANAQVTYRVVDRVTQLSPRNEQVRLYLMQYGPATRADVQAAFEAVEGGDLNKAMQSALHQMKAEGIVVSEPIAQ